MTISMYQASVPVFHRQLDALCVILTKAEEYAAAKKIDPSVLINSRLFPDMFPLGRQVQIVSDSAKGGVARLAGAEVPSYPDVETTFAELKQRCARTTEFILGFSPEQIDGSEDHDIVLKLGPNSVTFKGQQYLLAFALPNFFFHMTTAYNILRHSGVDVGKRDFLGAVA